MGVWDDLKKRLVVRYASEGEVKTPSLEDLDRFEQESGFRLPDDYREFATSLGPGTYGPGWQVETPGFAKAEGSYAGIQGLRHIDPLFVAFCGKEDFHGWFAWDPRDVIDPVAHDYGVYLLGGPDGHDGDAPPIKVSSTFREFLMSYALGGGFERRKDEDGDGPPDEVPDDPEVGFSQVL